MIHLLEILGVILLSFWLLPYALIGLTVACGLIYAGWLSIKALWRRLWR